MSEVLSAVARLDGYVSAIAAISGKIGDFSANAFLLNINPSLDVELAIKDFYANVDLSDLARYEFNNGFRDFEVELSSHIFKNILLGKSDEDSDLMDRSKYLSFRIMDYISDIFAYPDIKSAVKLLSEGKNMDSVCVYFCVATNSNLLVIQFDDNRN